MVGKQPRGGGPEMLVLPCALWKAAGSTKGFDRNPNSIPVLNFPSPNRNNPDGIDLIKTLLA